MINPKDFDTPPLVFESTDDYGWTTIARAIVDYDGKIHDYIKVCLQMAFKFITFIYSMQSSSRYSTSMLIVQKFLIHTLDQRKRVEELAFFKDLQIKP